MKAPFTTPWPQDIVNVMLGKTLSDADITSLSRRGLDLNAEHFSGVSPSSISSYWGSPCLVRDRSTSEAAERGTRLHSYMEIPDKAAESRLDQADQSDIAWARRRLAAITRDVPRDYEMREVKTYVFDDTPPHDLITWGIVDYLLLDGDRAIMADFKFGRLAVDVHTSMQLEAYACGILDAHDVDHVEIHVVQPGSGGPSSNCPIPSPRTVHQHDTPEIKARLKRLNKRVRAWRESAEKVLLPSASCQRCQSNNDCPAGQHMLDVYGDSRLPDILNATWEARLRAAKTMEEIAKRIRRESMQYIRGGGKIETHTVASRKTHKVTDFVKLLERWADLGVENDIPREEMGKVLAQDFRTAEAKRILKKHGIDFDRFWQAAERAGEAESYTSAFLRQK